MPNPTTRRALAGLSALVLVAGACADSEDEGTPSGDGAAAEAEPTDDSSPDGSESSDATSTDATSTDETSTDATSTDATSTDEAQESSPPGGADDANTAAVELLVETWNPSTEPIWPQFSGSDGSTTLTLIPTAAEDFDGLLAERLASGLAGDVIACRPYDRSLNLYNEGHLADISSLDLSRLPDSAFTAWTAEDGTRYCVPVSSVSFGFLYNPDIFDELGLVPPTTITEFEELLQTILDDGRYIPLALGTEVSSRPGNFLFGNLGPAFWGGEAGRLALADGSTTVADSGVGDLYELLARWSDYLPEAHELLGPSPATDMFANGEAAIFPMGSWRLQYFLEAIPDLKLGAFPTPGREPGDRCAVVAPLDFAFGMNPATEHPERTMEFLQFVASEPFAQAFATEVIGQFPLQQPLGVEPGPVEQELAEWATRCDVSLRLADTGYGPEARFVHESMWDIATRVIQGVTSPADATAELQTIIDSSRSSGSDG